MIYQEPNQLTESEIEYVKSSLINMLEYSRREFQRWKSTHNEIFLKQSGEKLFNATELFVEYVSKKNIESHNQFRRLFRNLANIEPHNYNKVTINNLIDKANNLHQFFYEGTNIEPDYQEIEAKWIELNNYLKNKIKEIGIK